MTISQSNFEAIREHYAPVFDALERAMAFCELDFYLIGAQSRDVWINHLPFEKKITRDIDFAVSVPGQAAWDALSTHLQEKENFRRDLKQPYRFYREELMLDLIPFGGMEKDGTVSLADPHTELSVYGCREVTEEAVVLSDKFKIITLPGLCILKLIAFGERPDQRQKDWDDFVLVLTNYGEIAGEQLYEGKYDDLITGDFDFTVASARMMGRHLQPIVNKNSELKDRILKTLESRLQKFSPPEIDEMYEGRDREDRQVLLLKLLIEVLRGLDDV